MNDTNDFNVTIESGAPQGSVLADDGMGVYTFTWTPEAIPARGLSFVAVDISGAATLHSPVVYLCACFNGGECTEQGVAITNDLLVTLTCTCTEGICFPGPQLDPMACTDEYNKSCIHTLFFLAYAGNTCSEDKNGCAVIECFLGVECFDVPAPGVGAECGNCGSGFTGDGLKCTGN